MSSTINLKPIPTDDYTAIVNIVQKYYCDGLRDGSVDTVSKAFHPEATMYGWTGTGGSLLGGPISNLWTFMKEHGDAPNIKTRIDIIGITPSSAVVKVDMENDAEGSDYTDFHTLLKSNGEWQIIAKVFHKYEGRAQ